MASSGRMSCRNELRAEIDKQIKEHREAIRGLKERRNTLAIISQLPVELISRIFLLAQPAGVVRKEPPTSRVCRGWRAISLDCAQIWTEIDCTRCGWAQALLARTASAPLKLIVSYGFENRQFRYAGEAPPDHVIQKAVLLALGVAARASYLHITLPKVIEPSDLPWPAAAPALHTLAITAHLGAENPYQLPDALMTGSFPQLRHLTLRHCSFNWEVPEHFRYLKELVIIGYSTMDALIPDMSKTLDALHSIPSLETLNISLDSKGINRLPDEDTVAARIPPTLAAITLPRLRVLEVALQDAYLAALLSHISYPQEQLMVKSVLHSVVRARAVVRYLRGYRDFKIQNGFTMDTLTTSDSGSFQLWDLSRLQEACPFRASLASGPAGPAIMNVIGTELPLAAMKTVVVREMSQLVAIYDHLDGCVTLCTSGWGISDATDFLSRQSFTRADGTRRMPELDTLILNRIDMSSDLPKTSRHDRLVVPIFMKQLQGVCKFIRALKLIDCMFWNQDKLDVFHRHVPQFERSYNFRREQRYTLEPIAVTLQKLISSS